MSPSAFEVILRECSSEKAVNETVDYMIEHMKAIIKSGETVLVCFPRNRADSVAVLLEKAIIRCRATPVFWEGDFRWNSLLKTAFLSHATTIIGAPMTILGLSKLAAHEGVPLNIYNAILTGYPCLDWVMEGIKKGLDCQLWGMLCPGLRTIVAGFSCECGRGIHLRDDLFGIETVPSCGGDSSLQPGVIAIYHLKHDDQKLILNACGSVSRERCGCGSASLKLVNIDMLRESGSSPFEIVEKLYFWSSILDCRVQRTAYGLEVEVVCFDGEKLPKLPSCAKLIIRKYDPEKDTPLDLPN